MTDRIRELEQQRTAAYKTADAAYDAELEAADAERERQMVEAEAVRLAVHNAVGKRCLRLGDWTRPADRAERVQADEAHKVRNQEIDEAYKALCKTIRARYDAACDAANKTFDRLCDEHYAAEDRKEAARERAGRKIERERAEAERKAERKHILNATRKVIEDATPSVVFVSPPQAAARVGLTMIQFWARVRAGVYPAPNDSNQYDADTVARLPRPKVQRRPARRAIPDNVLTQIWKF